MRLERRDLVLTLSTMGMEACWLYALLALISRQTGGQVPAGLALLLYPLSCVVNSLLREAKWRVLGYQAVSWLGWAVATMLLLKFTLFGNLGFTSGDYLLALPRSVGGIFSGFRPELITALATVLFWWLGQRLAYLRGGFGALLSEFQFGLVVLACTFAFASILEAPLSGSVPMALLFFVFGLVGISVSHAMEARSWLAGLYQRHWAFLLAASVGLIIIFGVLIAILVTPDFLNMLLNGVKFVFGLVLKLLVWLASLMPKSDAPQPLPTPMPGEGGGGQDPMLNLAMPEWLRTALRWGWTALMAGILTVALWRVMSQVLAWMKRRAGGQGDVDYEPMRGAFLNDIRNFFRWLLSKLRLRIPAWLRAGPAMAAGPFAEVFGLYRQFLRWAARSGFPRAYSQTPLEYCQALVVVLPEATAELDCITGQYVRTRYGRLAPSEMEMQSLKDSWYKLKQSNLKARNTQNQEGSMNGQG